MTGSCCWQARRTGASRGWKATLSPRLHVRACAGGWHLLLQQVIFPTWELGCACDWSTFIKVPRPLWVTPDLPSGIPHSCPGLTKPDSRDSRVTCTVHGRRSHAFDVSHSQEKAGHEVAAAMLYFPLLPKEIHHLFSRARLLALLQGKQLLCQGMGLTRFCNS